MFATITKVVLTFQLQNNKESCFCLQQRFHQLLELLPKKGILGSQDQSTLNKMI